MNKIFNFPGREADSPTGCFSIFNKIKFLLTKPKVVIVIGQGRKAAKEAIFQVLKQHFKVGKDVFVFETEDKEINKFIFFLKNSKLPILAITGVNGASSVKNLPANTRFVLNFDNDAVKEMKNLANANALTFGFQEKADIWISDVNSDINETNFKINYQGNVVPIWLAPTPNEPLHQNLVVRGEDKSFSAAKIDEVSPRYGVGAGKEQIYASLSAVAIGIILGLNLVEISQALRNYRE